MVHIWNLTNLGTFWSLKHVLLPSVSKQTNKQINKQTNMVHIWNQTNLRTFWPLKSTCFCSQCPNKQTNQSSKQTHKQTNKQANKHGVYLKSDKLKDFFAIEEHVLLLSVVVLERPGRPSPSRSHERRFLACLSTWRSPTILSQKDSRISWFSRYSFHQIHEHSKRSKFRECMTWKLTQTLNGSI